MSYRASFNAAGNIDKLIILLKLSHKKGANISKFSIRIFFGTFIS